MNSIPTLRAREVTIILEKLGFVLIRQRGSHQQYRHTDGRATTVPMHAGRDIAPALLRQIIKDIDVTLEHFLRLR